MRTLRLAIPLAALLTVGGACSGIAAAAPVDDPPSVAQVCAATGIAEVDALLDGLARTDLVGALSPLLELTVPTSSTAEVDASVQLDDIRQALNCGTPVTTTTTPPPTSVTPAPTTAATTAPRPRSTLDGFYQLDQVPTGAAETGGGPAA